MGFILSRLSDSLRIQTFQNPLMKESTLNHIRGGRAGKRDRFGGSDYFFACGLETSCSFQVQFRELGFMVSGFLSNTPVLPA